MPTSLKIYNSITRKKETFSPLVPGRVGIYVCGPTVYSSVHLGNLRTFIFFDMVRKYLCHGLGYKVKFIRNITDLGHEEYDEDSSKIEQQARLEQKDPMEIAQQYTANFRTVCQYFSISEPSIEPLATGHILEQIEIIRLLKSKGYAYERGGSIYFDIEKYNKRHPSTPYGFLSGNRMEEVKPLASKRDIKDYKIKKNSFDFALWKKANLQHIMRWRFPESFSSQEGKDREGFPGWHMECSAMSLKYLGHQFDIHAGGLDLKFPHHECEVAQSIAVSGQIPARYWMHSNMLTLNGKKMSKSEKNSIYPLDLIEEKKQENQEIKGCFSPSVIRLFMLQAHYRGVLDITQKGLEDAAKIHAKLSGIYHNLATFPKGQKEIETAPALKKKMEVWRENCFKSINDDFNTPKLISHLQEVEKNFAQVVNSGSKKSAFEILSTKDQKSIFDTYDLFLCKVLSLSVLAQSQEKENNTSHLVAALQSWRAEVRKDKNWNISDKIREILEESGVQTQDEKSTNSDSAI